MGAIVIRLTVEKKGEDTGQLLTKPVTGNSFLITVEPYGHLVITATLLAPVKRSYIFL